MKIARYGVQAPVEQQAAAGSLVTGVVGSRDFVGLVVVDKEGLALVVLDGGEEKTPYIVSYHHAQYVSLVEGEVFVEPDEDVRAFQLSKSHDPGALLVGSDGSLGIRAEYRMGGHRQLFTFDFETGRLWDRKVNATGLSDWRLMWLHPARNKPYILARAPID